MRPVSGRFVRNTVFTTWCYGGTTVTHALSTHDTVKLDVETRQVERGLGGGCEGKIKTPGGTETERWPSRNDSNGRRGGGTLPMDVLYCPLSAGNTDLPRFKCIMHVGIGCMMENRINMYAYRMQIVHNDASGRHSRTVVKARTGASVAVIEEFRKNNTLLENDMRPGCERARTGQWRKKLFDWKRWIEDCNDWWSRLVTNGYVKRTLRLGDTTTGDTGDDAAMQRLD